MTLPRKSQLTDHFEEKIRDFHGRNQALDLLHEYPGLCERPSPL